MIFLLPFMTMGRSLTASGGCELGGVGSGELHRHLRGNLTTLAEARLHNATARATLRSGAALARDLSHGDSTVGDDGAELALGDTRTDAHDHAHPCSDFENHYQ